MIRQFKKTFSAPSSMGRREFLQMIPLLAAAPSALAQDTGPVAVQKIHSCDMRVTNVARSVKFYQDLFGAPVQARRGDPHFHATWVWAGKTVWCCYAQIGNDRSPELEGLLWHRAGQVAFQHEVLWQSEQKGGSSERLRVRSARGRDRLSYGK